MNYLGYDLYIFVDLAVKSAGMDDILWRGWVGVPDRQNHQLPTTLYV